MLRSLSLLALFVLIAPAVSFAEITFEIRTAESTGIRAIFDQWYADEMKRQGGAGKSHGWWPWGLRALDYDRDGDLDLIPSHHGVPHSIVLQCQLKESGKLLFTNATVALSIDSRNLPGADDRPWIWDIDGDGWLDIAGFSDESPPLSVFNQRGKKFVATAQPLFAPLSHPQEVIDLDGDGYLDLDGGKHGVWIYEPAKRTFRRDETPRFKPPEGVSPELLVALETQSQASKNRFYKLEFLMHEQVGHDTLGYAPQPIDLNSDGIGDVVIHGSGGYGAVYLGRYLLRSADGKLTDATAELGLPIDGAPILIHDLTGDGRIDLLIVGQKSGGLYVQNETGRFEHCDNALSQFLTRRGPYLLRAYRADFDNDGDPDLVLSNPRLGRAVVFENKAPGEFASVLEVRAWDANPIVIADLDNDGRLDLAVGGGPDQDAAKWSITIYLNHTAKSGRFARIFPRMTRHRSSSGIADSNSACPKVPRRSTNGSRTAGRAAAARWSPSESERHLANIHGTFYEVPLLTNGEATEGKMGGNETEAASLVAAFTQASSDATGAQSGTASVSLAAQLRKLLPKEAGITQAGEKRTPLLGRTRNGVLHC